MRRSRWSALLCTLAVLCCMTAFSTTAFAFAQEPTVPPMDTAEETEPTVDWESEPLTPPGNLTLIDDLFQTEGLFLDGELEIRGKQFLTVQTKNGNYFYIVIDRSGDTENVYFLNMVDESDLLVLMEEDETASPVCDCKEKCLTGAVNTSCPVCRLNMSECTGKEPEPAPLEPEVPEVPEPEKKSGSPALLLLLVLILAGGGGFWYFKFYKTKADTRGTVDLDDYDYGADEELEYESEEEETEE